MDVDGVVSAVHPEDDVWGDEVTAGHLFGPVRVSPTMCRRMNELAALPHVVPMWLTSWHAESRQRMDPFPGRGWPTLAGPDDLRDSPTDEDGLGWWKWDALWAWLGHNRQIESLIWCDDHLGLPLWADGDFDGFPGETPVLRPVVSALEPEDVPFLTTTAAVVATRLAQLGVDPTLVAPATATGLLPGDLDRIEAAVLRAAPP